MNNIKVLIEGYARVNKDGIWNATSSTTLITSGKFKIIVDPGCNRKLLLESLKKEKIKTSNVDYVFISHYHPDHCTLMGIFENAKIFDSVQWQKGPVGGDLKSKFLPDTDIEIIKTPGHTSEHASLLVNTDKSKILVGADVFWWESNEQQRVDIEKHDEFASDQEMLKKSRMKVLKIADFIIPGHGKMFKSIKS